MRRFTVVGAFTLLVMALGGAAQAGLGERTAELAREHACGDLLDLGVAEHNCDETRSDVNGVRSLAKAMACGDVAQAGVAEHHCDETRSDVAGAVNLVRVLACTEGGADLDCKGAEKQARRTEKDAVKAADKALKELGH